MKLKSLIIAATLLGTTFYAPMAHANQKPVVESFTFTPTEVDILSANTKVDIELIVSHPSGIENFSTVATLTSSRNDTLSTYLTRIDSPVNSALTKVTYRGSLTVPRDIATGVYNFSVATVRNNSSAGYQYTTDTIESKKIRSIVGAESGLLVRSGGELNLTYDTFVGPSYDTTLGIAYNDSATFNSASAPIWKVGETFNPLDYYEQKVSALALQVKTTTPTVCSTDGKTLKLIAEGSCSFTVFTAKTNEFALYENKQIVQITSARIKSVLFISKIDNQTSKDLPKSLTLPQVYSAAEGYVLPKTTTPAICVPVGFTVRLISGGVCTLTYETAATSTYLASDVYQQTFEIVRDPQTITFTLPSTANVSARSITLAATASSGAAITYSTASAEICSITGSTLNLLRNGNCAVTATQAGTSTLAPVSATATVALTSAAVSNRKTITCVKGKSTKKVSGVNPKCPGGFKIKR
jgi:hypothetical protein